MLLVMMRSHLSYGGLGSGERLPTTLLLFLALLLPRYEPLYLLKLFEWRRHKVALAFALVVVVSLPLWKIHLVAFGLGISRGCLIYGVILSLLLCQ